MAVTDAHTFRVIQVDAVAIAYLQVVEQLDAVDDSLVAAHQVNRPIGSLADGHVADRQVPHVCQRQHMGPWVEGLVCQRLQLVTVLQLRPHEGDAIPMDSSLAGNRDVLRSIGIEPHHALTTVLTEGTQMEDALVWIGLQRGRCLQIEFHVALQFYGASQKGVVPGQEHPAATFRRATVDGLLYG